MSRETRPERRARLRREALGAVAALSPADALAWLEEEAASHLPGDWEAIELAAATIRKALEHGAQ